MPGDDVFLYFEGQAIAARLGESVAAALMRAGIYHLGYRPRGGKSGVFCGMGTCQECMVDLDGVGVRACMTEVSRVHHVRRRSVPLATPAVVNSLPPSAVSDVLVVRPEILVIGGGPGGLFAAVAAAEAGAEVVLVDERARPGGQYFKQPALGPTLPAEDDRQFAGGRALIGRARAAGVRLLAKVEVWGAFAPLELAMLTPTGFVIYQPQRLVIATGAYERGIAVPGWTLPGVMNTGAAQTLLRSYGTTPGKRVLVAGNGPLNTQVAGELARHGVEIVAVAELAPRPSLGSVPALWRMAANSPGLLRDGIAILAELHRRRVPVLYAHALTGIEGLNGHLLARLGRGEAFLTATEFEVDAVCMGYGFLPANELLRALDCRLDFDTKHRHLRVVRGDDCETTSRGVYAVGDCCGLGGALVAGAEGLIAGVAAAAALGHAAPRRLARECAAARRSLRRHRRFQQGLWQLFAAAWPAVKLATPATPVCRCESVTLGDLETALTDGDPSIGEIKRRTRIGMGGCQARTCAPILAELLAIRQGRPLDETALFAPRAPTKPVAIAELIRPARI